MSELDHIFSAFDKAKEAGDTAEMGRLLAEAKRLTGEPVAAADAPPSSSSSNNYHSAANVLGRRCQYCKLSYEGIELVAVRAAGGQTIEACQRCRKRKSLIPA